MKIPETRYVRSGELAIAYQVHGSGQFDIVFNGGNSSNVETTWAIPEASELFERLGRFARIIRFDRRDTGISDSYKDDLTLEAHAADALAVMEATGANRPFLLGGSDGARSLALLAATHPDRVAGFIALWPTVKGGAVASPVAAEIITECLAGPVWPGRLVDLWVPKWAADPQRRERLERFMRTATTPRQGERLLRLSLTSDVTDVLPLVQAQTLVMHTRDTVAFPDSAVKEFTELMTQAEYR